MCSKVLICVVFLVACAIAVDQTAVDQCGDGTPLPTSAAFYSPDGTLCKKGPCVIKANTNVSLKMVFDAPEYLENIKPQMLATTLGVTVPWPLGDDACDDITSTICPIEKGETLEYKKTFHVGIYPSVSLRFTFSIVNLDTGRNITCVSFTAKT